MDDKEQISLEEVKAKIEQNIELSVNDVDLIADIASKVVKELLLPFGEEDLFIEEYETNESELILDISEGDLALLIGRHGKTLKSFQTVFSQILNTKLGFRYPVSIDIEGYKNRRKKKLETMALSAANRAKYQRSSVALPPMRAYERRIVHVIFSNNEKYETFSVGEEPRRKVVIKYLG